MQIKLFEIRDSATCISAIAIRPGMEGCAPDAEAQAQRRYHLGRTGYMPHHVEGSRPVLLGDLNGRQKFCTDPYDWGNRTWAVAHAHIEEKFDELIDGQVIDVRVLAGEATTPAEPDRLAFGKRSDDDGR